MLCSKGEVNHRVSLWNKLINRSYFEYSMNNLGEENLTPGIYQMANDSGKAIDIYEGTSRNHGKVTITCIIVSLLSTYSIFKSEFQLTTVYQFK